MTSDFEIIVLGASGTYPGAGSACTGFLVIAGDTRVLLDAGSGTVANLHRHMAPEDLDAIVITHQHGDHCLDLGPLRSAMRYHLGVTELPVYGTVGTRDVIDSLTAEGIANTFDWHIISADSEVQIGPMAVTFSLTDHPVETLSPRFEYDGRSFVFSADTADEWNDLDHIRDTDLFICEATFLAEREGQGIPHLSARQAGQLAADAGAKSLVLTHRLPGHEGEPFRKEAAAAYGAPVHLAEVNARFPI